MSAYSVNNLCTPCERCVLSVFSSRQIRWFGEDSNLMTIKTLYFYASSIPRYGIVSKSNPSESELSLSLANLLSPPDATNLPPEEDFLDEHGRLAHDCDSGTDVFRLPQLSSLTTPLDGLHHPDCSDRSSLDLTAKFFYLNPPEPSFDPSWVFDALEELRLATGIKDIDTLILSFPKFLFDEPQVSDDEAAQVLANAGIRLSPKEDAAAMDGVYEVWKQLSQASTQFHRLGLSEFSLQRMKQFLSTISGISPPQRRPAIDQINLRDCCSIPGPLATFSKKENIELLTHSDLSDLLPASKLMEILSKDTISDKLPQCLADVVARAKASSRDLSPRWVLKYSVIIKDRSVVADKGYIVCVDASMV